MANSETRIFNTIKHHIAKSFIENKSLSIDDLMAIIAVSYFHFLPPVSTEALSMALKKDGQEDTTFDTFKESFSKYLKKEKRHIEYLKQLNQEGLRQFLLKNWIEPLPLEHKLSCCNKIIIIGTQDDKVIPLPGKEAVYRTFAEERLNQISYDIFGSENYTQEPSPIHVITEPQYTISKQITITHEDKSASSTSVAKVKPKKDTTSPRMQQRDKREQRIQQLCIQLEKYKIIDKIIDRNENSILEKKVLEKKVRYVWELKLPFSEWQDIKQTAEENSDVINEWGCSDVVSESRDKTIATFVLIYAAEWNKREWTGNDRDNKLGSIISSATAKKVVNVLRKYRKYPLPCVEFEDERHSRWLDALKVQGGFPLWYIYNHREDANNPYFSMFRYLLKNSEQELDWDNQVPRTVESNSTYRLSNEKNDSIAQYSWTILEQQYPYDVNDFIYEENGVKFEVLGEILRNLANSKFRYSWQVGKIGASAYVRLQISFRDERDLVSSSDERKYAIQEKRLRYWLNQDQGELPESFFISFNQPKTKKVLKTIYFDRCTDGSWIPRASYQYRYQLPFENEKKISVSINGVEFSENLHTDEEKGYQLMYSADNVYWMSNSLSLKKAYFACLIFDVDKYINTPGIEIINGGYGWVRSVDNHIIILTDENGKETRIFNNKDKLIASSVDKDTPDNYITCLGSMDYVVNSNNYALVSPLSLNPGEHEDEEVEKTAIQLIPSTHVIRSNTQLYFYLENSRSHSKIIEEEITIKEGERSYDLGYLPVGYHTFTFCYEDKKVTDNYFVLPADFSLEKIQRGNTNSILRINGCLNGISMLESTIQINGDSIYFNKNDHNELQYTLCLTINDKTLQIPIIPPYEGEIYIPQDPNRVIPLPFFWNIRKYEKKTCYDIPAEQEVWNDNVFLKRIDWIGEVKNFGENGREGIFQVAPRVTSKKDQYRFYYFNGEESKQLEITDESNLVLEDCKSWKSKKGIIIQSYECKTLSPEYFYRPRVLGNWTPQPSLIALLFAIQHRCQFRDIMGAISNQNFDIWVGLLEDYFKNCQCNEIVYQGLWRLAKEYNFDWIWLWPIKKDDAYYIRLLEERVIEPKIINYKMKILLRRLCAASDFNSRMHVNSGIKDLLKLMFRPKECYEVRRNTYKLGKANEVFKEDIDGDIQMIQEILIFNENETI